MTGTSDPSSAKLELVAYSALIPALPMRDAAATYFETTGVLVRVNSGRPEEWMAKLDDGRRADIVCCGAEFLLDIAEAGGKIHGWSRTSPGTRRASLVVPSGNPRGIRAIDDLARPAVRVGIAVEGCTLGLWDEVSARVGLRKAVHANISARAHGCGALLGEISHQKVDVAFGWSNFDRVPKVAADVVPLPDSLAVVRSTGLAVATPSTHPEAAHDFVRWLASAREAQAVYHRWGWNVA